ncbi:MAG: DNA adenine methylase [Planctomycetes bacterium]|nr:DNA adenine methylase [Planctomycetota bacterium]
MRYDRRIHTARGTDEFVFHQLVPYLGSKRHLLEVIAAAIAATGIAPQRATFFDAFAGSGVVARFAKRLGFGVIANDWEPYARVLNTAAIACDAPPACARLDGYESAIAGLNALCGHDGWISEHLCPADDATADPTRERMFYRRATGRRIDAIRDRIAEWHDAGLIDDAESCCLLAPLLYQACWLSNTSGVFKGFHHGWGGRNGTALHRILADLHLTPACFLDNGRRHRVTAADVLESGCPPSDIAYLDPPYNQHPYASNYHVLNSIVLWDKPALPAPTIRGHKAAIRTDWRRRRSPFNHRGEALDAYSRLLDRLDARVVLTSYSTDGTIATADLVAAAARRGALSVFCRPYKRYRTSPTRPSPRPLTTEFVLACDTRRSGRDDDVERMLRAIEASSAAVSA